MKVGQMLVYGAYNCLFNKMNDKLNWNNNQRQQQSSYQANQSD